MRAKGTIDFCFYRDHSIDGVINNDYLEQKFFVFYNDDTSIEEKYEEFLTKLKNYMDKEYGKSYLKDSARWYISLSGEMVNEIGDHEKNTPWLLYYFPTDIRWEQLFKNISTPITMIKTFSEQEFKNNHEI